MYDPKTDAFILRALVFNMDATQVVHSIGRGGPVSLHLSPTVQSTRGRTEGKTEFPNKAGEGGAPNPQRYKLFVCANAAGDIFRRAWWLAQFKRVESGQRAVDRESTRI